MRFLLLSAALLLTSMIPAYAQDAFAGADDGCDSFSSSGAPRLQGVTNGTIGPCRHTGTETMISGVNTAGPITVTRAMTAEEFKKAVEATNKLGAALGTNDLQAIALQCYKLFNSTGNHAYQSLGDIASEDIDLDDTDIEELRPYKDTLRRILVLQLKSETYIGQAMMRFEESNSVDGEAQMVVARTSQKVAGLPTGLRKLNSNELRVFVPSTSGSHEVMVRHCIKRSVEQICAATNNALHFKFVSRESDANLKINYDTGSYLWYNLQNHSTPILSEPYDGATIKNVKVHIPLNATMHRRVSEAECQEFCLREITRALGYAWAPVSMERFTHDFAAQVAKAKKQQHRSIHSYTSALSAEGSPGTTQHCVEEALYGPDLPGRPQYYAALAYFSKGEYDMARRYFCNATAFFNENSAALHSIISRYVGMGDGSSAELIAFACINDDPNNDEASPATREYERTKQYKRGDTGRALPTLAHSDAEMLAKIYGAAGGAGAKTASAE